MWRLVRAACRPSLPNQHGADQPLKEQSAVFVPPRGATEEQTDEVKIKSFWYFIFTVNI